MAQAKSAGSVMQMVASLGLLPNFLRGMEIPAKQHSYFPQVALPRPSQANPGLISSNQAKKQQQPNHDVVLPLNVTPLPQVLRP